MSPPDLPLLGWNTRAPSITVHLSGMPSPLQRRQPSAVLPSTTSFQPAAFPPSLRGFGSPARATPRAITNAANGSPVPRMSCFLPSQRQNRSQYSNADGFVGPGEGGRISSDVLTNLVKWQLIRFEAEG